MNKSSLSNAFKQSRDILIVLCLAFSFFSPSLSLADGESLLKQCETYIALEDNVDVLNIEGNAGMEASYCPGYIEGALNMHSLYQDFMGKNALFCLPDKKMENIETIRMVIKYLKNQPEEQLKQDEVSQLLFIFSKKYPCVPLMGGKGK